MADTPIPITRAEYEAKFGAIPTPTATPAPIPITRAEYAAKFGTPQQQDKPLNFGETITGGFGNMLNALTFNYGDEAVAGGTALVDALMGNSIGESYDQRLSQIRDLNTRYREQNPVSATLNDFGSMFLMPIKSKVATTEGTIAKATQAAKEGAALGFLYGSGSGEGFEDRAVTGVISGGVGAPLSAGVTAGFDVGGKLYNAGKSAVKSIGALGKKPEIRAGEILDEAVGDDTALWLVDEANPLTKNQTVAEITQSPNMAQIEQQIGKTSGKANDIMSKNYQNRLAEQKKYLSELSSEPQLGLEAGGQTFRNIVEPKAEAAREGFEKLFERINPKNLVNVQDLRRNFTAIARKTYKAGGMPGEIKGLVQEINDKITQKVGKETQTLLPSTRDYGYIKALRRRAQKAWVNAKNQGDTEAASVANSLVRGIDSAIDEAGQVGLMPLDDVATYKAAKDAASEWFDTYGARGVGPTIAKMKEGQYLSKTRNIIKNTFDGTAEGTRKILKAIGNDPRDIEVARGLARDHILRSTRDKSGNLSPAKFMGYLQKAEEGLAAQLDDGTRLFQKSHLNRLKKLSEELELLDIQSPKSVKQMAYSASRGQPTTAQALLMDQGSGLLGRLGATGRILSTVAESLKQSQTAKVDEILAEAVTDKELTRLLIKNARDLKPQEARAIASRLDRLISRAPSAASSATSRTNALLTPQVVQSEQNLTADSDLSAGSPVSQSTQQPPVDYQNFSAGSAQAPQEYRKEVGSPYQNSPTPIMEENLDPKQNISYTPEKVKEIVADQPPLIRAMVKQESGGKPKARSNKGASGLMQIMPGTAKEIARELGVDDYDLEDPLTSLIFGKHYIQKMYQEFNDPRLALAAYNAGPGKVKQWIKRWGNDWSTISRGLANTNQFSETRNYVRNIVNNAKEYA